GPARLREITRQEWEPRDEGDARALAMIEHLLRLRCRAALDEVVPVLHRDDRHELASPLDVRHRHLRQSDVTDLPLVLQLAQRAQLILERDSGIDAVQLVQLDALELEAAQAALTGGAQVLRSAVRCPPVGAGPLEPAFAGDHQLRRIRVRASAIKRSLTAGP